MNTTLATDELTFAADIQGPDDGDLVLFLHGFPQTKHTWRAELPTLAALGYRSCAYDQRGYSPGARPDGIDAYMLENLIEDVIGAADYLDHSLSLIHI